MKTVKKYWQLWLLTALCLFLVVLPTSPAVAALAKHTNCGFVTVAPTADPGGTASFIDGWAKAFRDVAPVGATKITEVGWWCDTASEEGNYEIGLYSDNAGDAEPEAQLYVVATNAKGTTAGWKVVDVSGLNWTITAGTTYWIAVQVDDVTTTTNLDITAVVGEGYSKVGAGIATLPSPWGSGVEGEYLVSIYAVYQTGGGVNKAYYRRRM